MYKSAKLGRFAKKKNYYKKRVCLSNNALTVDNVSQSRNKCDFRGPLNVTDLLRLMFIKIQKKSDFINQFLCLKYLRFLYEK